MYGYPYNYNQQPSLDRINAQINELEKIKEQMQKPTPTNLTQNFQLAPNNYDVIKYANSIDDVQKYAVMGDTPYFSKDMSVVWVKNTNGNIKSYELTEIVPKDERDIQIELLQSQVNELKGMIENEQSITNDVSTENESNTEELDEPVRTTSKTSKSSSVSRVPTSKKK